MNGKLADNSVLSVRNYLRHHLQTVLDEREIDQHIRILFYWIKKWGAAELVLQFNQRLSESEILLFHHALKRLLRHEPIQYVIGEIEWMGLSLFVNSNVLIPRPETEELVYLIANSMAGKEINALDCGTGSGCIALGLKKIFNKANIAACDMSEEALHIAKMNADRNQLEIHFFQENLLRADLNLDPFNLIVSNPPYIPQMEKNTMHPRVIEFEPHLALFTPDENPLIFYHAIIEAAMRARNNKELWFEIHESAHDSLKALLGDLGIRNFEFYPDFQMKIRFLRVLVFG
jgi:release factor glutamine methyltransferase